MYFLLNLSLCVKNYGHLCQILAYFTMKTDQIWLCHVTHVANFEQFKFFPDPTFNTSRLQTASEVLREC